MTTKKIFIMLLPFMVVFGYLVYYRYSQFVSLKTVRHYNTDAGFSMELPVNWQKTNDKLSTIAVSTYGVSVVCAKIGNSNGTLSFDQLSKESWPVLYQFKAGDASLGGVKAKWRIVQRRIKDKELKSLEYVFINNGMEYTINCHALKERFDRFRHQFERMADPFRFE